MLQAVSLARQGKGAAAPNPCVGALLVSFDGQVLAEGYHTACGNPHAEIEALADARSRGVDPAQCILFVTLEPCNHQGRTPPCTRAILQAGINHVVVGHPDPNPDVDGKGMDMLREHGVHVESGVALEECRDLIADFLVWKTTARPFVILKLASTLDGKIATRTGDSCWVTGEAARAEVHRLRSMAQAVMVGGRTFSLDNPRLTCRIPDLPGANDPLAVIVTSRLPRPDDDRHLLRDRPNRTVFLVPESGLDATRRFELERAGCRVWPIPSASTGSIDLRQGLERLRKELGCLFVLCEGGGKLAMSMAEQACVDEIQLFLAPKILGDDHAASSFSGREVLSMQQALGLRIVESNPVGEDLQIILRPREA